MTPSSTSSTIPVGDDPIPMCPTIYPGYPESVRIFQGRTGVGRQLVVDEVGPWLDVKFYDADGNLAGFSVNSKYTVDLAEALVGVLAGRLR